MIQPPGHDMQPKKKKNNPAKGEGNDRRDSDRFHVLP